MLLFLIVKFPVQFKGIEPDSHSDHHKAEQVLVKNSDELLYIALKEFILLILVSILERTPLDMPLHQTVLLSNY